jgi:tetratricopeptide (TPR) repeat protein
MSSNAEQLDAWCDEYARMLPPARGGSPESWPRFVELSERLLNSGIALSNRSLSDQALPVFGLVASQLRDARDPGLRKLRVHAQIQTGVALNRLGRFAEAAATNEEILAVGAPAVEALEEVAARKEQQAGDDARAQLAWILFAKAVALGNLQRREESLAALDEVIRRFENDDLAFVRGMVDMAREARKEVAP